MNLRTASVAAGLVVLGLTLAGQDDCCSDPQECLEGNGTPKTIYLERNCYSYNMEWVGVTGQGNITISLDPTLQEDVRFKVYVDENLVTDQYVDNGGNGQREWITFDINVENSVRILMRADEDGGSATLMVEDSIGLHAMPFQYITGCKA